VSPKDGLVVVVPVGARVDPAAIVLEKLEWATRSLARIEERHRELNGGAEALLPDLVEMPAFGMRLPIEYRHSSGSAVSARVRGAMLVVSGDVDDAEACLDALRRWLSRTAEAHLKARVRDLGARVGLVPTSVRVSGARTRWGSCSARGTVSLSRNSVFLPTHLLDALVLHELAHLKVLDHSPRFWACLSQMDPSASRHRKQLGGADALVPAWAVV
jgi:predicted metal-dependent hydrolase